MSYTYTLLDYCVASILSALAVATVISRWLLKKNPDSHTFHKVKTIIKSWWYIATPVLIALLLGPLYLLGLFYFITCYALTEFVKHSGFKSLHKPLSAIFIFCTTVQYLAIFYQSLTLFYVIIPLMMLWVLPILVILKAEIEQLPRLTALTLCGLLLSYYLAHVPALPQLNPGLWRDREQAMISILLLILMTELNDIFQFLSGKSFGRKKIVPDISPNKTEAGFLGALAATTALMAVLAPMLLGITTIQAVVLGALLSITGMFGDLLFSALKRYYGVKDFSDLIPGHGGLLDRLDSLILTAPLYFHLLYYFKNGSV